MEFNLDQVFDIVIYGSSGAGFAAAVQAARSGLTTILLEPGPRVGGMTTGGLGATDFGNMSSIGGIAREFYSKIYDHYINPDSWVLESRKEYFPKHQDNINELNKLQFFFEPSVALQVMQNLLKQHKVTVLTLSPLDRDKSLHFQDDRIFSLPLKSGERIAGRFFVDASYEGDLMAIAGVSHVIGREDNSLFGETLNGFRPRPASETSHISPFIIPGDRSSGILPGIEPLPDLDPGEGDHRLQAYNFRLCLTDHPENRVPLRRPENYDPLLYETIYRHIRAKGVTALKEPIFKTTPMPNRKTDSNNIGLFSTDFVGKSHAWPLASDGEREIIWQEHRAYIEGLLWFLGHDERFSESWRNSVRNWGYASDEFVESGNWPSQLYVREARRMHSDYVITESDCRGLTVASDSIAMGSYAMDSHQVMRFVDKEGCLRSEGSFWKKCSPYPISYRAIVPSKGSCTNLAVPVCLSSTHAAYGSIRMEPVFMMLGQAGAIAASIALRENQGLQEIDYRVLESELISVGAVLSSQSEVYS